MADKSPEVSPLQERVQKAAKVMKIAEDYVWVALSDLGIEKDDEDGIALLEADTTKEGDARRVFVEHAIGIADKPSVKVKPARFAAGWQVLKGREKVKIVGQGHDVVTPSGQMVKLIENLKPLHEMKDKEVLERYGPEASPEIIEDLLRRSNGRPFIIYKADNKTIDMDNTLNMLRTARRHETKRYFVVLHETGTREVRVYRADEFPLEFLEECPIHHGVILTSGYCDHCHDTWEGIEEKDRIVVRIARDLKVISDSLSVATETLQKLRELKSSNFILGIPTVQRQFDELVEDDRLPRLRKRQSHGSNGTADPLFQHKRF